MSNPDTPAARKPTLALEVFDAEWLEHHAGTHDAGDSVVVPTMLRNIAGRIRAALAAREGVAGEVDAWLVERMREGEWRWVVAIRWKDEAEHFARDERQAGHPARIVPLYRATPTAEPDAGGDARALASEVMQDDMRELMDALGIAAHARGASPHEVMQQEIIPAVRALRSAPTSVAGEPRFRCTYCGEGFDNFDLDERGNRRCPHCLTLGPTTPRPWRAARTGSTAQEGEP